MRYLLFREDDCPGCGGDGWALNDDGLCSACQGEKVIRVQVALVPEPVAEILVAQFGEVSSALVELAKTVKDITKKRKITNEL